VAQGVIKGLSEINGMILCIAHRFRPQAGMAQKMMKMMMFEEGLEAEADMNTATATDNASMVHMQSDKDRQIQAMVDSVVTFQMVMRDPEDIDLNTAIRLG
jgi:hypothetical protein